MTFDEIFETLPSNGWLSKGEAKLLYRFAGMATGPILEVGCYHGRSTVLLASFGRPVYCVDPFSGFDSDDPNGEKTLAAFQRNTATIGNVHLFHQRIESFLPMPCDFAYLDGSHTYEGTVSQIEIALQCRASIIAVHDVNDSGEGVQVKRAGLALLGPWKERFERLAIWEVHYG